MRVGCIGIQALVGNLINDVGTVGENLVFDTVEVGAYNESFELYAETVGELPAFGK